MQVVTTVRFTEEGQEFLLRHFADSGRDCIWIGNAGGLLQRGLEVFELLPRGFITENFVCGHERDASDPVIVRTSSLSRPLVVVR